MNTAATQEYLNTVSEYTGIPAEELLLRVKILQGGGTTRPSALSADPSKVLSEASIRGDGTREGSFPSLHYDSLSSKHAQLEIVHQVAGKKVSVPKVLFSWQHHPMPGCCRFAVNRWVQLFDNTWSEDLLRETVRFRSKVARFASALSLFITTGPSFTGGGELLSEFTEIHVASGDGQRLYARSTQES